jgi:hypothetical protein
MIIVLLGIPNYAQEYFLDSVEQVSVGYYQENEYVYAQSFPRIPDASCNCAKFAQDFGVKGTRVSEPVLYGGVRTEETKGIGHWAVILEITDTDILVIESNYIPCKISYRRIPLNSPKIKWFMI